MAGLSAKTAVIFLAAAACLLVGCGEDSTTTTGTTSPDNDTAASTDGDIISSSDALSDVSQVPATIGRPCATTTDCPGTLKCVETNAATGDGICTQTCTATADCPGGSFCHTIGKQLACTLAALCDPCKVDEECSSSTPLCAPGKDGKTFCTVACALGAKSCQPGYSCEQYGSAIDDFACRPDYGACSGGGEACAPCQAQADCKSGTQCLTSPDTGERACFQTCAKDADCASGFVCSPKGLCTRLVPDADPKKPAAYVQTCAKSNRGYCDSCTDDWQCGSGRCATTSAEIKQTLCAEATPCTKENETKDCPDGTFCVPSNKGMMCAPPPSWKCQGYKACLGKTIPCGSSEVCLDGLCKPK
jgi:hypothetical protein